jgi:hypothetical protein
VADKIYGLTGPQIGKLRDIAREVNAPQTAPGAPTGRIPRPDDNAFWAALGSNTVVDGVIRYAWTQQRPLVGGTFDDLPGGAEGTTTAGYATNTVDEAALPAGTVVWLAVVWEWDAGSTKWLRSYRFINPRSRGLHQGDIPQMITDEEDGWGPARFGP